MPMTLSTAVCRTTTITSSVLPASGKSSLRQLFDKLVSSRLALIPFLHQNAKSPTTSKIKCWKKGVQDLPCRLTSVVLTPAWIPPPSYMDQLPGSIDQSKVYRYDDFILEVSSGGETTFLYVANPSLIQWLQDLSTLCQICENQSTVFIM